MLLVFPDLLLYVPMWVIHVHMNFQDVSTEAALGDGKALWGVCNAPVAAEVIMPSCRRPLRSAHLLVG